MLSVQAVQGSKTGNTETRSDGERLPRGAAACPRPGRVAPLWGSAGRAQEQQEGGQQEGRQDRDGGRGRPPEGGSGAGGGAGPEETSNNPPASLKARSWGIRASPPWGVLGRLVWLASLPWNGDAEEEAFRVTGPAAMGKCGRTFVPSLVGETRPILRGYHTH